MFNYEVNFNPDSIIWTGCSVLLHANAITIKRLQVPTSEPANLFRSPESPEERSFTEAHHSSLLDNTVNIRTNSMISLRKTSL